MKLLTSLFLFLLVSPTFSQLTKDDLRTILREEITASEKRTKEYIDLKVDGLEKSLNARIDGVEASLNARIDALDQKIDSVEQNLNARIDGVEASLNTRINDIDKKFDRVWMVIGGLIALITAAIAAPPIIVALKEKGQLQKQVEQIHERLNVLENTPS